MVTEYQQHIMNLGGIQFENILDTDIIWFEQWDQGHGMRCFFHLYKPNGNLKDIICGKAVPLTERKMQRPPKLRSEEPEVDEPEEKVTKKKRMQPIAKISLVKKERKKYNITPEEKFRRAELLRKIVRERMEKKRTIPSL